MTATFVGVGAAVHSSGSALSPTVPSYTGPAHIFIITGHSDQDSGGTRPSFTGSGGIDMGDSTGCPNCTRFWFVDATGVGFTVPSGLTWGSSGLNQYAYVEVWQGLDTGQTEGFTSAGRDTTSTNLLPGPSVTRTPAVNNSVVFLDGIRVSTQSSPTISAPSGFTMTQSGVFDITGRVAFGSCYQIQTTATAIPVNTSMSQSPADSSNQNCQGTLSAAEPLLTSFVSVPPLNKGGMIVQVCQ